MEDIIQQIENVFAKHKLIGNKDFSEDEYALMVDYVSTLSDNFDKDSYKLIFATLVSIAKRWRQSDTAGNDEENCGYWDYVFKTLFGSNIDQQLCQKYRNVISWLGKNANIPIITNGQNYYATLMMHSFAPKNSIFSFFDLCYTAFKKDLDFGFTSDDEWYCEEVASKMRTVLRGGYREDKKVSIGSSAYSIKIGLRSFALHEDLSQNFVQFIKDTFEQINKLFNREKIDENTRLKRYIVEWWKNKTESEKVSDDSTHKKRIPTVSKQDIVVKYNRDDNKVRLCIPFIRLDDCNNTRLLSIYVNGKLGYSEEMRTKRGELVITTQPVELELNELLKYDNEINLRVEIKENGAIIFDSEKNKTTSLYREFILFEDDKEVLSLINKPTNYFVYSKNIDGLKNTPQELTTYGTNIYNIYPTVGESLTGETRQVFFVNKEKAARLGNTVCLIGNLKDVEWLFDEYTCVVYGNSVKLMIPETLNLKSLELQIDSKIYKLENLKYEQTANNCYQFGLKALGLIAEDEPTEISVFSYEKDSILLLETIISLPNLDVKFNHSTYYGDIEQQITITDEIYAYETTWSNQDNEIKCPLKDGILLAKVPYFRWQIGNNRWHKEPINRKLWYKNFIQNGDLLEIDNPIENEEIKAFCKIDGQNVEITKNQSGKFEIGRAIYANQGKKDIFVYCTNGIKKYDLFTIATKEHFVENPLRYNNGAVIWDVENTFVGDKYNDFFLIATANGKNEKSGRKKVGSTNVVFGNFEENVYEIIVKIKDKNPFFNEEKYNTIFEDKLIVGKREQFRFKNKRIKLLSANCFSNKSIEWIPFIPKYFIDDLQYIEEEGYIYYKGNLCVIEQNGETRILNTMLNEREEYDKINPVRIELRDNSSLWLVAGWQGGDDFIGNLFCDKWRKGICNIAKQDAHYDEINLYKYKEEEYV